MFRRSYISGYLRIFVGSIPHYDSTWTQCHFVYLDDRIAPQELRATSARGITVAVRERKEESYVAPPKTVKAFAGKGMQLGRYAMLRHMLVTALTYESFS